MRKAATVAVAASHSQHRAPARFQPVSSTFLTGASRTTRRASAWAAAKASLERLEKNKPFKEPVVTEIALAGPFYAAEDYHQDYYKKNPIRYKYYRTSCGRDDRIRQLWGSAPVPPGTSK